jgi:hypothetical protein
MWNKHNKFTAKTGDVMDIERLKKLNSLAGELKHQGIAHNHEDAAYLAVNMVGEEEERCLSDMHLNEDQSLMVKEIIRDKPAKKQEEVHTIIQPQSLSREEVEIILQNFASKLVAEFNALHAQLEQNSAQLQKLMQTMSTVNVSVQPVQKQEQVPVQRTLPQEPTQAVSTANPRTGNFATDDVCIEKMFYFGAKK